MENFKSHKREIFWYNIHVPRERSSTLFDIGGRHPAPAIGPKPVWADGKTPESAGRFRRNRRRASRETAFPGSCGNASDARSMYATAYWCFRENHYFLRTKRKYGVAPYGNHAAQPLFLCFVQARSGASRKQGIEGAPLFFSAPKRRHTVW